LDPVSRRVSFGSGEVLLVDTVGFINKLPHDLVNAFRATLEETRYADLLLHVVDTSSENREQQMEVVCKVLAQLGAGDKPILTVYNKVDVVGDATPKNDSDSVSVSAITGVGMEDLKNAVIQKLAEMRNEVSVLLPLDSGALVSHVYATGQVIDCQYQEDVCTRHGHRQLPEVVLTQFISPDDEHDVLETCRELKIKINT
jgi:GTP-binding protein HflX